MQFSCYHYIWFFNSSSIVLVYSELRGSIFRTCAIDFGKLSLLLAVSRRRGLILEGKSSKNSSCFVKSMTTHLPPLVSYCLDCCLRYLTVLQ